MKNRIIAITALALSVVGGIALVADSAYAQQQTGPVAGTQKRGHERHPDLRKALRALTNAEKALDKGAHDFGGHRANAEKLTEQAIAEVKLAYQDDKH